MQKRILALAVASALTSLAASAQAPAANAAASQAALTHLQRSTQQFGLAATDVREAATSSAVYSAHNGVTHVYLQQVHRGIEVWGAIANVNVPAGSTLPVTGSSNTEQLAMLAGVLVLGGAGLTVWSRRRQQIG